MADALDSVRMVNPGGPRGELVKTCTLRTDGLLEFYEEDGNYCSGTYLSPEFYSEGFLRFTHDTVNAYYFQDVMEELDDLKKRFPNYVRDIVEMLNRHNITVFRRK